MVLVEDLGSVNGTSIGPETTTAFALRPDNHAALKAGFSCLGETLMLSWLADLVTLVHFEFTKSKQMCNIRQ